MRMSPTTAKITPRVTHGRWSIMKLEAGQWTRPVPWPIHSNPINTAATPMISKTDFITGLSHMCAMGGKQTLFTFMIHGANNS